jgi:hypothetical protein
MYDNTPYVPMAARSNATPAKMPSRSERNR